MTPSFATLLTPSLQTFTDLHEGQNDSAFPGVAVFAVNNSDMQLHDTYISNEGTATIGCCCRRQPQREFLARAWL